MTEIIWHGRGGQGAFTASRLLGEAYTLREGGGYALAFPSFGPERRGAPIRAFTKLDAGEIRRRRGEEIRGGAVERRNAACRFGGDGGGCDTRLAA